MNVNRVKIVFEIDNNTLNALRMFADMLDFSVEEYIEDYLEWEFKEQPDLNLECACGADGKSKRGGFKISIQKQCPMRGAAFSVRL